MTRILVTGARGFIGTQVVRVLATQGHTVFAAARKSANSGVPESQDGDVRPVEVDLEDVARVRSVVREIRPAATIHLVWYLEPGKYWTAPANLDCVAATLRLAHELADVQCGKLVCTGSCAEYDWHHCLLREESTPLAPQRMYGACKNSLREILEIFCRKTPMQLVWARLFYLYGPGEKKERLVPTVIRSLLAGKTAHCLGGDLVRDFLYVEDAAAAIAAVANSNFSGTVNVASGLPVKVRAVVETIGRILGCRDPVSFDPVGDGPPEPARLIADVNRLTYTIGWKPARSLTEGLSLTVEWWKANSSLAKQDIAAPPCPTRPQTISSK
jgi:nucleoside-diphosphate-sugar epimerase